MTDEVNPPIDPNTADEDTLAKLPGVGPVMAQRILAARPFETLADLKRVTGIGPVALARLQPHLALSPAEAVEAHASAPEELSPAAPPEDETGMPEPPLDLQPEAETLLPETAIPSAPSGPIPTPVSAPPAGWVTRGQAVLLAFISSFLALILALILSLAILAALNNGRLQFATPAQVNRLSVQIEGLDSRAGSLEGDLQSLRNRVANLEPLGQRVEVVETSTQNLETNLDALTGQVDTLTAQADDLSGQMEALQAQTNRFQGFVDGLRTLLNNLFAPVGEGK